jgi:hypothetical protein
MEEGKNKRLRFSVHFDAESEEFNQLLQTGLLNLAGQGYFNPPPPPVRPPLQPHPSITNILVEPHVSLQPEIPVNDGWNEIVHNPQPHHHGGLLYLCHYLHLLLSNHFNLLFPWLHMHCHLNSLIKSKL